MKIRILNILGSLALLILYGCMNPYNQYYRDFTLSAGSDLSSRIIITHAEPVVTHGANPQSDFFEMTENGYALIGVSSFNGAKVDDFFAVQQARKVEATNVIIYSKYSHTVNSSMPLILPNTQTTTTTLSGNINGYGGNANYYGTANSTTYGTQVLNLPVSVDKYETFASFWTRVKPSRLGVITTYLPDEVRAKMESNKGIFVISVVRGSPAFKADLLRGDVIKALNGVDMYSPTEFTNTIKTVGGNKITLVIYRNGREFSKEIEILPGY